MDLTAPTVTTNAGLMDARPAEGGAVVNTKVRRLATLLIVLGEEAAAGILRTMDSHDREVISGEIANLPVITEETRRTVLMEFTKAVATTGKTVRGGVQFAQNVLEKAVGPLAAGNILERVAPGRTTASSMSQISDLDAAQVYNLIKDQRVQAIALVISFLAPQKASKVLAEFRPELHDLIMERLATLGMSSSDVIEIVSRTLTPDFGDRPKQVTLSQSGGVKSAAAIMMAMNKDLSQSILESIGQRNPALMGVIRNKMFSFADMVKLDPTDLRKILREIDARTLALALKPVGDNIRSVLLSCLSKRAADDVKDEISFLTRVRVRDIETAQNAIMQVVHRFETEGAIDLGGARENEWYEGTT